MTHLNPKPTILQVVPDLETGGVEQTTLDIAKAIIAAALACEPECGCTLA